jgi:hypothetical protein
VDPQASLLTTNAFAAQLADRRHIEITQESNFDRLDHFDQVLLDRRHPGFLSTPALVERLLKRLDRQPEWDLIMAGDDIHLFRRRLAPRPMGH